MLSKYIIILIWVRTNECFKNNPTSEKDYIVRTILHLSMGTKRKSAFETKINNRHISYRGMESENNYIQIYIKYNFL